MKRQLQATQARAVEPSRTLRATDRPHQIRCYTIPDLLRELALSRRTFFRLRRAGRLPFLDELLPRLGRSARYRAEPIDRYLAGHHGAARAFRRSA